MNLTWEKNIQETSRISKFPTSRVIQQPRTKCYYANCVRYLKRRVIYLDKRNENRNKITVSNNFYQSSQIQWYMVLCMQKVREVIRKKRLFWNISQYSQRNICDWEPYWKKRLHGKCFTVHFEKYLRASILQNMCRLLLPLLLGWIITPFFWILPYFLSSLVSRCMKEIHKIYCVFLSVGF